MFQPTSQWVSGSSCLHAATPSARRISSCAPAAGGSGVEWRFIGPQATLFDAGVQTATHFQSMNPSRNNEIQATWQHSGDSSAVWATEVRGIARLGLRGAGRNRVAAARGDGADRRSGGRGRSSPVRTGSSASTPSAASSLPPVDARRRRSTRACWCRTRRTTTSISNGRPGRGARASPPPRAPDARGRRAECGWRIRAEGSPHEARHAGARPPRACSGWRPAASRSRARCAAGGSAHHAGAARRARHRLPPARYARG